MNRAEKDIQFIRDIDRVLLEEADLLAELKQAVAENGLDPADAEQVIADFHEQNAA
jgi:hypothetical protein